MKRITNLSYGRGTGTNGFTRPAHIPGATTAPGIGQTVSLPGNIATGGVIGTISRKAISPLRRFLFRNPSSGYFPPVFSGHMPVPYMRRKNTAHFRERPSYPWSSIG